MKHSYINNRDIVLFAFQPWETETGSNLKDMAEELSKNNRVLFFNRAADRASLLTKKAVTYKNRQLGRTGDRIDNFQTIHSSLSVYHPHTIVESINRIPFKWLFDKLNRINNKRLAEEINKAIAALKFSNVILVNDNDFIRGRYLKELVTCSDCIFYLRDYLLGVPYFQRHGKRLEAGALKDAHMVMANSAYLAAYARRFNPNSFDIGQGCNVDGFTAPPGSVPEDIRNIKKPIIGYTGYISAWRIDIKIIQHVAGRLPGCSIVLIGPLDKLIDSSTLRSHPNIYWLGSKSPDQLPGYVRFFDICINPQVLNDITRGNYPRKIDEYLSIGKPVVATKTEAMLLFESYVFLCLNKTEYVEAIEKILFAPAESNSEAEQARRRSFALTHSWSQSMSRFADAYYSVKNKMPADDR